MGRATVIALLDRLLHDRDVLTWLAKPHDNGRHALSIRGRWPPCCLDYGFSPTMFPEKIIEMVKPGFVCRTCGQTHEGVPLSFAADSPDMYANMPESDRDTRALVSSDQCIVDEAWFFVRGCLEIPLRDSSEAFIWGLWASVKKEVFNEMSESWEEEGRETRRGPFKGRLANSLSLYPETLNLKLRIVIQPVATRPLFILEEKQHPLARAQQHGISRLEAMELSTILLHIQGPWSRLLQ